MTFEKLISKVKQAEHALEAQERHVAADVRQFKTSWRAAWTPGRIVIAGLLSGFVVGRAEPVKQVARSGGAVQLFSMLTSLFAADTAKDAKDDAKVAESVTESATATSTTGAAAGDTVATGAVDIRETPEAFRQSGQL